jgi:hypothetical protein
LLDLSCGLNVILIWENFSQVFLGQSGGLDAEGNELPRLVYVSREKRPGFQHHKKAGAMNSLVSSQQYEFWRFFILFMYTFI